MDNHGMYIASLGNVCRWLGQRAEELGVEVFPGFAAAEVLFNDDGSVKGVATGDMGIGKNGEQKDSYAQGMELHAKYTLFAEGCRGSLSQQLMSKFNLRDGVDPQVYGIGVKELWQVPKEKHQPGLVVHSQGWPLPNDVGGGSFLYHFGDGLISVGFVTHLSYANPHLSPFEEMQRFKTHPAIRGYFEGGKRLAYGARAINEGGLQSIPKLTFPGGALIGCTAGFVNLPRIKGSHNAMKTGMLAAEAAFAAVAAGRANDELTAYPEAFRNSWAYRDLHKVRNVKPGLKWGLWAGTAHGGFHMWLNDLGLGALVGWTLRHGKADHECLRPAAEMPRDRLPEARRQADVRPALVGVPVRNGARGGPAGAPAAARSVGPGRGEPRALRRARKPVLPGGRVRVRAGGGRWPAAADQRAELRALQDVRHQGPAAEHPLGDAGRRRRSELRVDVGRDCANAELTKA